MKYKEKVMQKCDIAVLYLHTLRNKKGCNLQPLSII